MAPYSYARLPEGSVRLLHILPHLSEDSPVECRISTCALLNSGRTHNYEALSYVWGSEDSPKSIHVGGQEVPVGANLHSALTHLRDGFVERALWIDAICINQQDNVEKGQQIQSMALIYSKASRVVVWLGDDDAGGGDALEALRVAGVKRSLRQNDEFSVEASTAILQLLRRPWFQRVWVRRFLVFIHSSFPPRSPRSVSCVAAAANTTYDIIRSSKRSPRPDTS